jgi:crotonobetainyl-CoA:carnitine CoA-transferase CaiB-like acyl-CoA transferase
MSGELPLEGIRVVDLTMWIQGPVAAQILADLGAEVLKVERPGVGDHARGLGYAYGRPCFLPDGRNIVYETANRNKKSVAIDLSHPRGREAFYRLVKKADLMVTNLSPEALRSVGADEASIHRENPEIIYVQGSGFGPRGPYADDACQDTVGMARSGFMFALARPGGEPSYPAGAMSDVMTGTMLGFGALAALMARERTGRAPRVVYASQVSSMMWLAMYHVALYANLGLEYEPSQRSEAANPLMSIYRCADGKWFASGLWMGQRFWHDFCQVTGLQHLEHDPRFNSDAARAANRQELVAILDEVFASQPREEWERRYREKGLLFAPVNRYSELPDDPQVVANEYIVTLDTGYKMPALPFAMEGFPPPRHGAPAHGQHTDEVLQEVCGYTLEEVLALKAEGAVW